VRGGRAVGSLHDGSGVTDHRHQQFGLVHGAALDRLVDNVLTFACGTVLGAQVLTSGLSVTYLAGPRRRTARNLDRHRRDVGGPSRP
jgi:acyl-coenzyme A thioesterase PaaI-like protein